MTEKCKEDWCFKDAIKKGWCNAHYLKFYKSSPNYAPLDDDFKGKKQSHPLYMIWFERKQGGYLCDEWKDFKTFINAVTPKPDGNFFLLRIDGDKPFGPDNFRWQEHLKRKEGETNKDWWARKRKARLLANPSMERERNYKRNFGITLAEYNEKFSKQKGLCSICGNEETSFDSRTGSKRKLAIDHCHKRGKIRDLLCWRCNGTLGKIDEDLDLLKKIENYIIKHKEN